MALTLPLVSVHVVTYNQRNFVEATLASILEQDYPALQVVVSDDGSTDGTAEIVNAIAAREPARVIAITGGPNLGISGNSNRCLRRCSGKYIAFLAGDDLMLPGKLRAQVDWFEQGERRAFCGHDVEHFDSTTGRTLKLQSAITKPRSGVGAAEFLRGGYYSATSSVMVRASTVPAYGFDERIRVHSDWKFAADCLVSGGEFGYVRGIYGRYRLHDRNSTVVFSDLRWVERHMGLAILEAEHPELASACSAARAYAYFQKAVFLVQKGEVVGARQAFGRSFRQHPFISWKLPAWWALSLVPPGLLPTRARRP